MKQDAAWCRIEEPAAFARPWYKEEGKMDRINPWVGMLAMALVLGFDGIASAQEGETTEQVDWEEAAEYADLVDTFVSDRGSEMNTYYDGVQNVLWSQPADVSIEDAIDALSHGAEPVMELGSFQWIVPTHFWLCHHDETNDHGDSEPDPNCSEGCTA